MGFMDIPTIDLGATGGIADPSTPAISVWQLIGMIFGETDIKMLALQAVSTAIKTIPAWYKSCEATHAKAEVVYTALKQVDSRIIAEQGLKPLVSIPAYDENPVSYVVNVEAVGPAVADNTQPGVMLETFALGQDQRVTIDYDLYAQYWGPQAGCQGEWAWIKILGNKNGQPWVAFEKIVKGSGTWTGFGTEGYLQGEESINLPAGQYVVMAVSTGSSTDFVSSWTAASGKSHSYAKATVHYSMPVKMQEALGIPTVAEGGTKDTNKWIWIALGCGGVYLLYKTFNKRK